MTSCCTWSSAAACKKQFGGALALDEAKDKTLWGSGVTDILVQQEPDSVTDILCAGDGDSVSCSREYQSAWKLNGRVTLDSQMINSHSMRCDQLVNPLQHRFSASLNSGWELAGQTRSTAAIPRLLSTLPPETLPQVVDGRQSRRLQGSTPYPTAYPTTSFPTAVGTTADDATAALTNELQRKMSSKCCTKSWIGRIRVRYFKLRPTQVSILGGIKGGSNTHQSHSALKKPSSMPTQRKLAATSFPTSAGATSSPSSSTSTPASPSSAYNVGEWTAKPPWWPPGCKGYKVANVLPKKVSL
jgi:hypothetical protein